MVEHWRKFADASENVPSDGGVFVLGANYPDPFNPITTIPYQLGQDGEVTLTIYNLLGEKVITLVRQKQARGSYRVTFDAAQFSSGIYIYRLKTDQFTDMKKMILIK